MSFEALALSANSWQLTTLKPYPSHEYPLISMVSMWIGSCPVFSTLNVLFNVKFGSLSFKPEGNKCGVSTNLATTCARSRHQHIPPECLPETTDCLLMAKVSFTQIAAGSAPRCTSHEMAKVWLCFIFHTQSVASKACNEYWYFNLLRSEANNPESKSGSFFKNLKSSSLVYPCAHTQILFLYLEWFTVESKCGNLYLWGILTLCTIF